MIALLLIIQTTLAASFAFQDTTATELFCKTNFGSPSTASFLNVRNLKDCAQLISGHTLDLRASKMIETFPEVTQRFEFLYATLNRQIPEAYFDLLATMKSPSLRLSTTLYLIQQPKLLGLNARAAQALVKNIVESSDNEYQRYQNLVAREKSL